MSETGMSFKDYFGHAIETPHDFWMAVEGAGYLIEGESSISARRRLRQLCEDLREYAPDDSDEGWAMRTVEQLVTAIVEHHGDYQFQTRLMSRLGIMLTFWPPDWICNLIGFFDRFVSDPPRRGYQ